ncbi:uncharacterized protein EAE97_010697 [Botrytis byssoidea]|uniref:Secreted protein CSS2 C-terminal domain-containing protein n=1 Tax=Botrytis byssoidea TaxID=139641 RepID=A0A9P5HVV0_9HELO|nr:uncharacterized protein EAE97_010697 [Botrytis byssoidea]KAF7924746.1 hypothetical protein EAE97_010697 [Botrytis byssoidea]
MRITTPVLLAMSCTKSVYSLAIDGPSTINGQPMPERWIRYDLTPVNTTSDTSLVSRTNVKVCERILAMTAQCLTIVNIVVTLSETVGAAIKSLSDAGSCGKSYGSLDNVSWVYYATGSNCDITTEIKTIQGAIKQHLTITDRNSLCSIEYLDLIYSGIWNSFLLIRPTNSFDSTIYCEPSLSFGSYTSKRKNNI